MSQAPQQADAIIVLGGSEGSREEYAARLYHEGYAQIVLISGHVDHMAYNINILTEQNVPESATIINDQATTTYDEAQQILEILIDLKVDSALIVTNHFHTRRASATYEQVFADHDIDLTFVSPDDDITAHNWWKSKSRDEIMLEYPKMLYYWLAYGVWSG